MQHILIVEDDLDIQDLLRNFLQEVGYEITIASDGMEAIALFSSAHFDLILLDIMLPKIDGFTVCELIRKQSQVPSRMSFSSPFPFQKLMPFSDISQNDKITFSDTKSYPDCPAIGNAEKVDLFRYPITRMREMNYSKQSLKFQIGDR